LKTVKIKEVRNRVRNTVLETLVKALIKTTRINYPAGKNPAWKDADLPRFLPTCPLVKARPYWASAPKTWNSNPPLANADDILLLHDNVASRRRDRVNARLTRIALNRRLSQKAGHLD